MNMRKTAASVFQPVSVPVISGSGAAADRLRCDTEIRGHAVVMRARGEVDGFTLSSWQRAVRAAASAIVAPGPLIIDLRGLDFISCRAFAVLAEQATWCRGRGIDLRLVSTAPIVTRVITAAGLTELLLVSPGIDLDIVAGST